MTDRVRILCLARSGDLIGGAQIQYQYLIEGLNRSGYEPLVLTPAAGPISDALARAGLRTWVFPYPLWRHSEVLRWRHKLWLERRRVRSRLLAFARTHAVRLVRGDFDLGPYITAIAEALGIPSVVHVRGSVKRGGVRRYALLRASALIVIGDGYRDQLLHYGVPSERITVIADATDLARFTPRCSPILRQEDSAIAANDVLFGIVGRLEPFKRQLDFLHAAEQVIAAGRRAHFFVIGAPNRDRPRYVRRVQTFPTARGIDRRVTFTGPRLHMDRVMASLDVLVTLSGGSVMLEAMASGVPVVTASARSPAELKIVRDGEAGLVVPAGNADALVRALLQLCDDVELRRSLGAKGRHRVETQFGRDRLVSETVHPYDALMREGLPFEHCRLFVPSLINALAPTEESGANS